MASVNKVILVGNLGRDPELKSLESGMAVCTFSLATNERWKDKSGEAQERTEWHRIVTWGKIAEACGKYLSKGRPVYVEGRLQTRSWTDPNHEDVTRYATEIVAQVVQFLGNGGGAKGPDRQPGDPGLEHEAPAFVADDGDIPF